MRLNEGEFARLIREAPMSKGIRTVTEPVNASFGIDGVYLDETPENQWAIDLVKKWRTPEIEGSPK